MIRPLRVRDWPRFSPFARRRWFFPESPCFVAEEGGRLVGFVRTSPGTEFCWQVDALQACDRENGEQLLDALLDASSRRGITNLTAEVDLDDPWLELYFEKGFRRYSNIAHYRFDGPRPQAGIPYGLRRFRPRDERALLELHKVCTPSSVRLVDSRTVEACQVRWTERLSAQRFVVIRSQQLLGYLKINGSSIQVLVHPGVEDLYEELFRYALARAELPAFASAPEYQPLKRIALEQLGWEKSSSGLLLVKDSLLTIKLTVPSLSVLEDPPFKPAWSVSRFPAKTGAS